MNNEVLEDKVIRLCGISIYLNLLSYLRMFADQTFSN